MVYIDINRSNTHADPLLGSRWAQMWVHMWVQALDERRNLMDREILEKCIDLGTSCLNTEEILKVMDMLYKYKEAFSLRDKIGTCPNIEVEIEVTDKSPFFMRPYHVREEDKVVIDKEMERLCYMGILKEGLLAFQINI